MHNDGSLFTHYCDVEPSLISLQVLVLLGLVQSASGCKYMGLQEALAHLHGLTIGQLPRRRLRGKSACCISVSLRMY